MRSRPLYDIVAVPVRLGVGGVFIAHGWQKIQVGITATARQFDVLGVPAPTPAAIYATFVELLGGVALILGIGLPVAGILLFLDMAGAFVFVHADNGLFMIDDGRARNGFELVLVLGLTSLLFAVGGAGRLTLDHWLPARRRSAGPSGEPDPGDDPDWPGRLREDREPAAPASGAGGSATRTATGSATDSATGSPAGSGAAAPKSPRSSKPSAGGAGRAESGAGASARPRLASEIASNTAEDTLVAGGRKSRIRRKQSPGGPAADPEKAGEAGEAADGAP